MNRLEGKTAIVTGAGAGIGWATARQFASEGARVIAVDRDAAALAALGAQVSVEARTVDITDADETAALVASLDRLDVLFNCAGMVAVGSLTDCSDAEWEASWQLNVTSIFHLCRAAVPVMRAQGSGSIINMASVISSIGGVPDRFAYGVTKAAVIGMTKSIARDYADAGIRCNAICPSAVETPSMTDRINAMEDPQAARAAFASRQPVGRMGTPEEIAELATYLASDASGFMTGSAVVIDGGAKL